MSDEIVSSEQRAETFANHLEKIQWAVRPTNLSSLEPAFDHELTVDMSPFTLQELHGSVKKMKFGKVGGLDNLPSAVWKALEENSLALKYFLDFCSLCLSNKTFLNRRPSPHIAHE